MPHQRAAQISFSLDLREERREERSSVNEPPVRLSDRAHLTGSHLIPERDVVIMMGLHLVIRYTSMHSLRDDTINYLCLCYMYVCTNAHVTHVKTCMEILEGLCI